MNIILASGSPRRRELLASALLEFSVMAVDIDEAIKDNESPSAYIERMVASKAQAAIAQLSFESHSVIDKSELIILTADTLGVLPDGQTVLIKPTNREHAYRMWRQMSDSTHEVWTCVQATHVLLTKNRRQSDLTQSDITQVSLRRIMERTQVTFVPLTQEMMSTYWDTGEPADKAGGYGIQGLAAAWVTRINGSYTNVVGLPLAQTLALINEIKNTQ